MHRKRCFFVTGKDAAGVFRTNALMCCTLKKIIHPRRPHCRCWYAVKISLIPARRCCVSISEASTIKEVCVF